MLSALRSCLSQNARQSARCYLGGSCTVSFDSFLASNVCNVYFPHFFICCNASTNRQKTTNRKSIDLVVGPTCNANNNSFFSFSLPHTRARVVATIFFCVSFQYLLNTKANRFVDRFKFNAFLPNGIFIIYLCMLRTIRNVMHCKYFSQLQHPARATKI